jgi:hypothetical protein
MISQEGGNSGPEALAFPVNAQWRMAMRLFLCMTQLMNRGHLLAMLLGADSLRLPWRRQMMRAWIRTVARTLIQVFFIRRPR